MTTYFKKITNLSLPTADPDSVKGDLLIHFGRSQYYNISDKSFYNAIANSFSVPPKQIFLGEVLGPLNCHIDYGVSSCLNYYLRPAEYITEFWEPIENARRIRAKRYDKATDTYKDVLLGYERDDCILKDSFVAEAGDMYILNISKVHSLTHQLYSFDYYSTDNPRSFIQCQWHNRYFELIKMMEI